MKNKRAFTLIELLVVIAIIAILAGLITAASSSFQRKAQGVQSLANLRQLGAGFMNYTSTHDGEFPALGMSSPGWGAPTKNEEKEAWYNSVTKAAGSRSLSEFQTPADFYVKSNVLFLPIAKYPALKETRPYFAIAINASLYGDANTRSQQEKDGVPSTARVSNLVVPARTVIFFESGLPNEDLLPGQNLASYEGLANGGPGNLVARYNTVKSSKIEEKRESEINMIFGDGHVEPVRAKDAMDTNGGAYDPQLEQYGGHGKVSWTLDPEAKP